MVRAGAERPCAVGDVLPVLPPVQAAAAQPDRVLWEAKIRSQIKHVNDNLETKKNKLQQTALSYALFSIIYLALLFTHY